MSEWVDCEPTIENFWKNVKTVDSLMNLNFTSMILSGYFSFSGNEDKNYRDLELELRENNINFGLIASNFENDNDLKKAINDKKVVLIKKKYQKLYRNRETSNIDAINPDHIAKYFTLYSCRPRDYVIKETLQHSKSIEENLEKLKESGDIISLEEDKFAISKSDKLLSESEMNLSSLVLKGKKLLKVKKVDLAEIFNNTLEKNSDATLAMHAMAHDGSPIFALVKNNRIISPIGLQISLDTNGNKVHSYLPLSSI